jgi:hypothetical protein
VWTRLSLGNGTPWCEICYDPASVAMLGGTAMQVGGKLFSGYSAKRAGETNARLATQEGEFTAQQLERVANEERVAGQRSAQEQRHKTAEVASTLRANAAASGAGGMETPTVLDLMSDTVARGEYLARTESYIGESRARGREDQALASRLKGRNEASRYKSEGRNAFYGSILDALGDAKTGYVAYDEMRRKRKAEAEDAYDPSWSDTTVRYG